MDRFIVLKQCEREEERDQFVALYVECTVMWSCR